MCTVLLPPDDNPIVVNKYHISNVVGWTLHVVHEHVSCLEFRDCPKFVSFFIEATARCEFLSAFVCVVFYLILRILLISHGSL